MKYLFPVYGATNGTATSGTVPLSSHFTVSPVNYISIPQGIKAKIWSVRISGAAVNFQIQFTQNVNTSTPTWVTVENISLASAGEVAIDKSRKPTVLEGKNGNEAIQIVWAQSTAAVSYIILDIEFTDEDD
jgi:hypothetical protein